MMLINVLLRTTQSTITILKMVNVVLVDFLTIKETLLV